MNKKNIFIILLFLMIGFLVISSASAVDSNSTDVVGEVVVDEIDEELSAGDESDVLSVNYTPKTSNEIQICVDNAKDNDTIILEGTYKLSNTVRVNKSLTFVGINDAIIDGSKNVRLFSVSNNGVIFKNISFINGESGQGSAIDGNCLAINCKFMYNPANGNDIGPFSNPGLGGAMYGGSAVNCTFISNSVGNSGGAMYDGSAVNCSFVNNSAVADGGAMYDVSAVYCNFINNSALNGGAVCYTRYKEYLQNNIYNNNRASNKGNEIFLYASNTYGSFPLTIINNTFINCLSNGSWFIYFEDYKFDNLNLSNCNFINCSSSGNGGAISFLNVRSCSISDCYFEGNYAIKGGAIYHDKIIKQINNCYFKDNSAEYGGAIFSLNKKNISNCSFENNFAFIDGANIFFNSINEVNLINCNFTSCSSNEKNRSIAFNELKSISIYNCNFINCSSKDTGGAIFLSDLESCNIINSNFKGNSATNGGALYFNNIQLLNISNCDFEDNLAYSQSPVISFDDDVVVRNGGAIYLNNVSSSYISNCNFNANRAYNAGAIHLNESNNLIDACNFTENIAYYAFSYGSVIRPRGDGGAIIVEGHKNVIISNSFFKKNTAEYSVGGGIIGNCTIVNSTFIENRAIMCAGIYGGVAVNCKFIGNYAWVASGGALCNGKAINCYFEKNSASSGGAVFNSSVINCSFVKNTASSYGGAIYNCDHVESCVFINCSSHKGGAVYSSGGLIENCVFINCSSDNQGAAIYCSDGSILNISKCSFENCSSKNNYSYLSYNVSSTTCCVSDCIFDIDPEGVDFKYNPTLLVNNLKILKNEQGSLIANLSDIRGQIFNKTINFIINNITYNFTTDEKGLAFFNINEYITKEGRYDVNVSFIGDEHVNPVSTNAEIIIYSYRGFFVSDFTGKYYDDVFLWFKLTNSNTLKSISNATIKVDFNNGESIYLSTDDDGVASYKVPFAPGSYIATASVVDDNADVNKSVVNFIVENIVGKMVVTQVDNNVLNVRLFNPNNGDVYKNVNLSLKFEGFDPIYQMTNDQGVVSYSMPFEDGTYSVLVSVSKKYSDIDAVLLDNIVIGEDERRATVKFSSGIVFDYACSGSIYVNVEGGTVERENIKVLNHPEAKITFVKNVITVSNLNPGKYTLFVSSTPFGEYKEGNGTVGITVRKATAVIKASKLTVALKSGTVWTIKIVDSKTKNPISNMKVTLKVYTGKKYKTVTLTTNSKGEAKYKTSSLKKGNHKVVVSASHKGYNFNTLTSSIKVIKAKKLTFKVKKKVGKDGSTLSITVKYKKKTINKVKIKLLVYTGKKYKTVVLKSKTKGKHKGVCGWGTNKISVGTHKIVIKPVSIKYKGSKKVKLKIKKSAKKAPKWESTD